MIMRPRVGHDFGLRSCRIRKAGLSPGHLDMVVGGGMMARAFSAFRTDRNVAVFASGVSDSLEERPEAFERERSLLLRTRAEHPGMLLVYFGTCSTDDPDRRDTPYVQHKLAMESLLEHAQGPWMILRVALAIGPAHRSKTLAQFLFEKISSGQSFPVWTQATRYPIDVVDTLRIASYFIAQHSMWNRRVNVALRAFSVMDFVRSMELIVDKRAHYEPIAKGKHYELLCPEVKAIANRLNLDYSEAYLHRVLSKYFGRESIKGA